MKRQSITDAAARVSAPGLPNLPSDDGQEAVCLVVRGGDLIAIVPKGTPDDQIEARAVLVRGSLRLEDERVLTFQVAVGPGSTSFEALSPSLHHAHAEAAAAADAALKAR